MIKKFKIFEKWGEDIKDELFDQLSDNDIDTYYDKYINVDVKELLGMWSSEDDLIPNFISNYFQGWKYMDDRKEDIIRHTSFYDFDKHDYKSYIENNLTEKKEKKIIEIYNDNYYYGDEDIVSEIEGNVSINTLKNGTIKIKITSDNKKSKTYVVPEDFNSVVEDGSRVEVGDVVSSGKNTEYESDMLDELDAEELRDVIDYDGDEKKFIEDYVLFDEDEDAEDVIKNKCYDRGEFMQGRELIDTIYYEIKDYIDEEKIIREYKNSESDEHKKSTSKDALSTSKFLQKRLIQIKKSNILKLVKFFLEEQYFKSGIKNKYKYQKLFIDKKAKQNPDKIAKALLFIKNNTDIFGNLNSVILKEYNEHTWLVDGDKFNL